MNEERIFTLLGKKLSKEATEEELAELAGLLREQSVQPHILELLQEIWEKQPRKPELPLEAKWEKMAVRFDQAVPHQQTGKKRTLAFFLPAAASVLIILALGGWLGWFQLKEPGGVSANSEALSSGAIVMTANGERKKLTLPDGTRVHLNSGSRLTYNENFGNRDREVWLAGEAFFEVEKNPARPFLVNTSRMVVKVLGTVFNVKAYDTQEDIETTVVEGKVEVSLKDGKEKKVVLLPSEKISLKSNRLTSDSTVAYQSAPTVRYAVEAVKSVPSVQMPAETAWIDEKVVFDREPFEIVALKMERWYNVHIHFENEKLKKILMTGDFNNAEIEEALEVLQIMVRFKYTVRGNHIYISAN